MSLADYTHVVTLGCNCTPSYQLARAAWRLRLPEARISGPFDWCGLDLQQGIEAIKTKFRNYFSPEHVDCLGLAKDYWKVVDRGGIQSWHHLRAAANTHEPTTTSWFTFGVWLGRRLSLWESTLSDPSARLLLVRAEDAARPDTREQLEALLTTVKAAAKCEVVLAAIGYSSCVAPEHAQLKTFRVRPSWPEALDCSAVDWDRDYGWGPAWQGHTASWDRIWASV